MPVKIEAIHSVGRFLNYTAKGDTTFKKLVTLFAPNGNGKSTLSDLFRSVQTGNSDIIVGRHTIGCKGSSEIILKLQDGKQSKFDGTKWNRVCPDISIFDDIFVEETIHSGNSVEAHQHQRLHQIVIGKESVDIQSKMDAIDRVTKKLNEKISNIKKTLEKKFPKLKAKKICDISLPDNIDNIIKDLSTEIDNLKQTDKIKKSSLPNQITALASPCNTAACLSVKLSDLVAKAREKVQNHLEAKGMDNTAERWIQNGMKWSDDGNCPFCGQDLANSHIFNLFETYFDAEYEHHITSLEQVLESTQDSYGDKVLHNIQITATKNDTLMTFWNGKIKTVLPKLDVDGLIIPAIQMTATDLKKLVEAKIKNPVVGITIDESAEWITNLQIICEEIQRYNETVSTVCKEVQKLRELLDTCNLAESQRTLNRLEIAKSRHTPRISSDCNKLTQYEQAKKKLTSKKTELRTSLNELSKAILKKHGANINSYLRQFGTGFKIANLNTSHPGGKPRTTFEIMINDYPVKTTGNNIDLPHFGNTLSTGDKRALAFAFFLSMVNQDPELGKKLIIFDDPFSSLDSFRRNRTKDRILELIGKARVVFVMSHDNNFLWHVAEKAGKQQKAFKIVDNQGSSFISEWDIRASTLDSYQKDIEQLRNYVEGQSKKDLRDVARSLRTALEGLFRREFPAMFAPKDWLNDMIEAVKAADRSEKIARYAPAVQELEDIKEYANQFHHSNVKKDTIQIDSAELKSFAESVLFVLDGEFEK